MKNGMPYVFPGNFSSPGSVIALPELPPLSPSPCFPGCCDSDLGSPNSSGDARVCSVVNEGPEAS